ncbi:HXXEE domain-containing protein [Mesobacillus jeotgali]|uniref:HXXEE domain-containing protein n=1 Tax=Mesobacillus jeotgali TaxID=129985 RepID=UPI0009A7C051|nr:HXXEE domain-containing protein [Mesobacillus jeotgali]
MELNLHTLIWLFPIIFVLHDFEEIIMLEKWMAKNRGIIKKVLPERLANNVVKQFSMTTAQMSVAVLIVFLFVCSSTFMASQYANGGLLSNIHYFTVVVLIFLLHVFTHVGQSILFRSITPGVITSIFLVLPYSLAMLNALFEHRVIDWDTIYFYLPFVILALPIVLAAHWIGKRVV